ncbi:MAG: HisA/HisF-related TIM barrel protein [Clostridia bacterium]|nr:HisA/HisF-related TIM barrel protein [Clostridia bacterium]
MQIYPAIYLLDGKCVRLSHDNSDVTLYHERPLELMHRWIEMGATHLHVVDLDAAQYDRPINVRLLRHIVNFADLFVQIDAGIRSTHTITTLLRTGAARIVLGKIVTKNPLFAMHAAKRFPHQIACSIESKNGISTIPGRLKTSSIPSITLVHALQGVDTIIYSDTNTDRSMAGPNLPIYASMVKNSGVKIIASGGIYTEDHIQSLADVGVDGVIIDTAIYDGIISLDKIIQKYNSYKEK